MKIINKIIALVMLFSIMGCESFLNLEPENDLIQEDYWKTEAHVKAVMMSSYVTLRNAHTQIFDWGEMRSDALNFYGGQQLWHWNVARKGNMSETMGTVELDGVGKMRSVINWSEMYKIIGYSNLLLENIPSVVEIDSEFYPAEGRAFIAESKTLRALAYFYLVRTFRDVPLILEAYETDGKDLQVANSSEKEVIAQIIKDLKEAIPDMAPSYSQEWESFGRATKLLAMTLLADVYLYNENYQECVDLCSDVILDPTKTLIKRYEDDKDGNASEDEDEIDWNNSWLNIFFEKNTNESIFEIQFNASRSQYNGLFHYFCEKEGEPLLIPNPQFIDDLYDSKDIRKSVIWHEFDVDDNPTNDSQELFLLKYMGIRYSGGSVSYIDENRPDRNMIIYRLAEVYLMRAEAYACLGEFTKALTDINTIRERAYANKASIEPTKKAFEDYILDERYREFMGEGKSWFDLLRVARRNNYERKDILIEKLLTNVDGVDKTVMETMLQNPDAYYLPIHKDELDLNNLLVQNPYYD